MNPSFDFSQFYFHKCLSQLFILINGIVLIVRTKISLSSAKFVILVRLQYPNQPCDCYIYLFNKVCFIRVF